MLQRNRLIIAIAVIALIPVVALAWWLASPLFIDKTVDEELPFAIGSTASTNMTTQETDDSMAMDKADDAMMDDAMAMEKSDDAMMDDSMAMDKPDDAMMDETMAMEKADDAMAMDKPNEAMAMDKSDNAMMDDSMAMDKPDDTMAMDKPNEAMMDDSMTMDKPHDAIMDETMAMEKADDAMAMDKSDDAMMDDSMTMDKADDVVAAMDKSDSDENGEMASDASVTQSVATLLKQGSFRDADSAHRGSGTAAVYQGPDGSYLLRLEDFNVTNGPDLRVILSPHENPTSSDHVSADGYIELDALKGNMGNQNYAIPADVDISAFNSVVIYCKPFHVIFSVASLAEVN